MMTTQAKQEKQFNNQLNKEDSLVSSVRILSDFTLRDIEKSYNFPDVQNAKTYFSNRYGETLKRTID